MTDDRMAKSGHTPDRQLQLYQTLPSSMTFQAGIGPLNTSYSSIVDHSMSYHLPGESEVRAAQRLRERGEKSGRDLELYS